MQHEDLTRILGRHKRRLLDKLEGGSCPDIYRDAVKIELDWLRDDLRAALDGQLWDGTAEGLSMLTVAGNCTECGRAVYHRRGKPGEYDHECGTAGGW